MVQEWLNWLERVWSGGRGERPLGGVAGERVLIRICFDGRGSESDHDAHAGCDLVVVPAVWHRRTEILVGLLQVIGTTVSRCGVMAELVVLHDAADLRLARQCEMAQAGSAPRLRIVGRSL